jgi:hypothetical protein
LILNVLRLVVHAFQVATTPSLEEVKKKKTYENIGSFVLYFIFEMAQTSKTKQKQLKTIIKKKLKKIQIHTRDHRLVEKKKKNREYELTRALWAFFCFTYGPPRQRQQPRRSCPPRHPPHWTASFALRKRGEATYTTREKKSVTS